MLMSHITTLKDTVELGIHNDTWLHLRRLFCLLVVMGSAGSGPLLDGGKGLQAPSAEGPRDLKEPGARAIEPDRLLVDVFQYIRGEIQADQLLPAPAPGTTSRSRHGIGQSDRRASAVPHEGSSGLPDSRFL